MGAAFRKLLNSLFTKKLEVVLVGLENSGKTTLLQVISQGSPLETAPTIGLNVKMVKRGGVNMKCWDLGGQSQYRAEWGRYTRGCDAIVYVVDASEGAKSLLPEAKRELYRLLEDKELSSTPLLIVANKIDLTPLVPQNELIKELNLDYMEDNPWLMVSISALKSMNVDEVVNWLIKQADKPKKKR
jgi:ADP-ribosylation factor-like protein 8